MDVEMQAGLLRKALKSLYEIDLETLPQPLTAAERSRLVSLIGSISIALDHWKVAVHFAPMAERAGPPLDARALKASSKLALGV